MKTNFRSVFEEIVEVSKFSVPELMKQTGISQNQMSRLITGTQNLKDIKVKNFMKLASALGYGSADAFWQDIEEREKRYNNSTPEEEVLADIKKSGINNDLIFSIAQLARNKTKFMLNKDDQDEVKLILKDSIEKLGMDKLMKEQGMTQLTDKSGRVYYELPL